MRFIQFKVGGGQRHLGVQTSPTKDVINLSGTDPSIPNSLVKFLECKDPLERVERVIRQSQSSIPLSKVTILAPISEPEKVICVGMNYKEHCEELGISCPTEPVIFNKFSSSIVGPFEHIRLPTVSNSVDWEAELAVVIGKKAKDVKVEDSMNHVFGYTVAQDVSARDWLTTKRNNGQYLLGKSMDTFCPLGPAVIPKSYIPNVNDLAIRSWVNGDLMQNGNTSTMIFKIDFLVSYLSQLFTLNSGDLLLTGTPKGVGMHRNPPLFLKKNDVLETEIESIGRIKNIVI